MVGHQLGLSRELLLTLATTHTCPALFTSISLTCTEPLRWALRYTNPTAWPVCCSAGHRGRTGLREGTWAAEPRRGGTYSQKGPAPVKSRALCPEGGPRACRCEPPRQLPGAWVSPHLSWRSPRTAPQGWSRKEGGRRRWEGCSVHTSPERLGVASGWSGAWQGHGTERSRGKNLRAIWWGQLC